jgi:hypothetical protein
LTRLGDTVVVLVYAAERKTLEIVDEFSDEGIGVKSCLGDLAH